MTGIANAACVVAAIDLGPSSRRVLRHAAGFARLLGARLKIAHVTSAPSPSERQRLVEFCRDDGPYEINPDEAEFVVSTGVVSDAIYREAHQRGTELVVMGSRGRTRVARLLLGSTSEALLRNAPAPVLLVPPIDLDIVDITDHVSLTSGPILAAVDLAEPRRKALRMASRIAQLAGQPLILMTVAPQRIDDHNAAAQLRGHGHALEPVRPRSLIVRRGQVAEEISRAAIAEDAGLVVMGLRSQGRGQPGTIASAVLATRRAFVLAVPGD